MTELERNETAVTYTTIQGTYYEIYTLDAHTRWKEIRRGRYGWQIKHDRYTEVRLASTAPRKRTIWDEHCQTEVRKENEINLVYSSQIRKAFRIISDPQDRENSVHASIFWTKVSVLNPNMTLTMRLEMTGYAPKYTTFWRADTSWWKAMHNRRWWKKCLVFGRWELYRTSMIDD